MAGRQGLEPRYAAPEAAVLPLDDLPVRPNLNITQALSVVINVREVRSSTLNLCLFAKRVGQPSAGPLTTLSSGAGALTPDLGTGTCAIFRRQRPLTPVFGASGSFESGGRESPRESAGLPMKDLELLCTSRLELERQRHIALLHS